MYVISCGENHTNDVSRWTYRVVPSFNFDVQQSMRKAPQSVQ